MAYRENARNGNGEFSDDIDLPKQGFHRRYLGFVCVSVSAEISVHIFEMPQKIWAPERNHNDTLMAFGKLFDHLNLP